MTAKRKDKSPPRLSDVLSIAERRRLVEYSKSPISKDKLDIIDARLIELGLVSRVGSGLPMTPIGERVVALFEQNYSTLPDDVRFVESAPKCMFGCRLAAEYHFVVRSGDWLHGCSNHWKMYRSSPDLGEGKGFRLQIRLKNRSIP